jgi:hypothetical protein
MGERNVKTRLAVGAIGLVATISVAACSESERPRAKSVSDPVSHTVPSSVYLGPVKVQIDRKNSKIPVASTSTLTTSETTNYSRDNP